MMNKLRIATLLLSLLMVGCDGLDSVTCYSNVMDAYPHSDVRTIPGSKYLFLVRMDSGEVRLVKTMNLGNTEITTDIIIFKAENKELDK